MRKPDPRTLLLTAACFSLLAVLIEATWLLALVLAAALLTGIALGAKVLPLMRRLKSFIIIVAFAALMQSLFHAQGQPILLVGGVHLLTTGGLLRGINILLRMGTVIAAAGMLTIHTSRQMTQGLIQMRLPYELAFMASVALRFLPVFAQEFKDTLIAVQLRGVDIKRLRANERLAMYTRILAPVMAGALDKAQKLSISMELRAFRAHPKRTSRFVLRLSGMDCVCMILMILVTAIVLYGYYTYF